LGATGITQRTPEAFLRGALRQLVRWQGRANFALSLRKSNGMFGGRLDARAKRLGSRRKGNGYRTVQLPTRNAQKPSVKRLLLFMKNTYRGWRFGRSSTKLLLQRYLRNAYQTKIPSRPSASPLSLSPIRGVMNSRSDSVARNQRRLHLTRAGRNRAFARRVGLAAHPTASKLAQAVVSVVGRTQVAAMRTERRA
jgi:hypothetical protein